MGPHGRAKATANFLSKTGEIKQFISNYKSELEYRLVHIFKGIKQLQAEGFRVDAIAPQAAMYLTVKIDLTGMVTSNEVHLKDQAAVTQYLLEEAKLALVPFNCFGAKANSPWYRLSVGTCRKEDIEPMLRQLKSALEKLR